MNVELALSSGDKVPEHVKMAHDLGAKVDLILSSLDAVNSKLESINAVVVSLEQKLNKVQGRVEMLEQGQAKSKDAIKDMYDGLQALNTIIETSKTALIELRFTARINARIFQINYCTRTFINGARIFAFLA